MYSYHKYLNFHFLYSFIANEFIARDYNLRYYLICNYFKCFS